MTATQAARRGSRAWLRCPWAAAGLAGLRDDAPSHTPATQRRRCEGRRRDLPRCRWAAAGPGRASRRRAELKARGADGSRAGRRPPAHTAAGPSGTRPPVGTQNRPATGAGRLSQYQRLIAGSRQCRGLRGHSPGERWKYRAWRQYPSRFPPCGDPRRRRWRSAWPSRQRSRRRCPRSRPGSGSEPAGPRNLGCRCR